ncbi:hypothetical protein EV182_008425, partial [Spiromyces aspiralis]
MPEKYKQPDQDPHPVAAPYSVTLDLSEKSQPQSPRLQQQQQQVNSQKPSNSQVELSNYDLSMPPTALPPAYEDDFNWENFSEASDDSDDDKKADAASNPKRHGRCHAFWRLHPLIRGFV